MKKEKQQVCREMLDAITGLAYFMVLSGETSRCYQEALEICVTKPKRRHSF
jgi:hypothetical protein